MKIFTTILLLSFSYIVCAQQSIFVRVFDLAGIKIHKGHVLSVTDTSLHLKEDKRAVIIPVQSIGSIKTKRSGGHNVLVGSIIGVTTGAILGAATSSSEQGMLTHTTADGLWGGAVIGLPIGAAIGGIVLLLKNSTTFIIDGDVTKWKRFQLVITDSH